jgi:hypothetical protein
MHAFAKVCGAELGGEADTIILRTVHASLITDIFVCSTGQGSEDVRGQSSCATGLEGAPNHERRVVVSSDFDRSVKSGGLLLRPAIASDRTEAVE